MAKVETHVVDGSRRKLVVHRKGATRALPAHVCGGYFNDTGHPVIIPGNMAGPSYVMVGLPGNDDITFSSSCHGAGRVLSRKRANEQFTQDGVEMELRSRGVYLHATTKKAIIEESPESYKNIDDVVRVIHGSKIAAPVAKLIPVAVMKG